MAFVAFYEKPGCAGNARQKAALLASGHVLDVRDLLSWKWSPDTLRPFFLGRPVTEWFNAAHPAIKAGEIVPSSFSEDEALALMCAEPLYIRRPLMEAAGGCMSGFDDEKVQAWIGLKTDKDVGDSCPSTRA